MKSKNLGSSLDADLKKLVDRFLTSQSDQEGSVRIHEVMQLLLEIDKIKSSIAAKNVELMQEKDSLSKEIRLLNAVTKSINDIVYAKDCDGKILMINDAGLKLIGEKNGDIVGKYECVVFETLDTEVVKKTDKQVIQTGKSVTFQEELDCSGTTCIYLVSKSPLYDETGKIAGVVGIGRDITDQVKAERNLFDSERRFRSLSEAAFEGILIHEGGIILDVNQAIVEMVGFEPSEIIGKSGLDFITPEYREVVRQKLVTISDDPYEAVAVKKDGTRFPVTIRSRKLHNGDRDIRVAAIRDISEQKRMIDALHQREQQFRVMSEQSLMGIVILTKEGFKFVNKAVTDLLGYSKEEMLNMGIEQAFQIVHPDDREMVVERFKSRLSGDKDVNVRYSYRINTKNDGIKWVEHYSKKIKFDGQDAVFVIYVDITEEKLHEKALRKERDFISTVLETVGALVIVFDAEGKVVLFNKECERITGYKPEEVEGKTIWGKLIDKKEKKQVKKVFQELKNSGLPNKFENNWITKTGDERLISWTNTSVRDESGEIEYVIGTGIDITEKRAAENALIESEERYHILFEDSPVAVWEEDFSKYRAYLEELKTQGIKDLRKYFSENTEEAFKCAGMLKVLDVNKAALSLYVASSKEMLLGGFNSIFWEESYPALIEGLIVFAEGNSVYEFETSNFTLDGTKIHVFIKAAIAPGYEEDWSKVLVSVVDITERKKVEEELARHRSSLEELVGERTRDLKAAQEELLQKERFAALGHLTAVVSHELRNPLGTMRTSIYGLGEALQREDSSVVEKTLDRLERSINRCDRIIEELLDFTRTRDLILREQNVDNLLIQILDDYSFPKNIVLNQKLNADISVSLDKERIERCLLNLLDNACHAIKMKQSEDSKSSINLESRVKDDIVEISITDDGYGIPDDELEKIFEPLYSTKSFGVGLGLSIVKQIINEHGGGIDVKSKLMKGTEVVIWLPLSAVG